MSTNQIIMIAIVVLISIIAVVGLYFLIMYLLNRKREKKIDNVFNPTNLVEEESLMNVMDEKRNVEYKNQTVDEERFVMNNEEVEMVTTQSLDREQKINPFGVDMTMRTNDNTPIEIPDPENKNKFIK